MTARCISCSGDHATVVLTPCWLARLFGGRAVSVDLEYAERVDANGRRLEWRMAATRRWLSDLDYAERDAINYALDFREIGTPSRWALSGGTEAIAP